uniref:Tail collar fiber protein n=1 Tax=Caudovirales sp. ctkvU4 TaxID=2826783 RepID=A0A8S5QQE9_9CAUD|nr:MAG TPA: tail collar fiber protein [Caudovirales sp. ctkvU4]
MSNWIPVVITKKGLALQAKVEAGTVLKFTKMALGSGKPPDLATATALASLKQNLAIASKDVNNNTCVVYATGTNIGVTTAYQASELGLYAQDPDEGEILYAVTTDDTPDTVPSNSSATVITQRIGLAVAVSASSTVSVVLSTTGFITAADAENIANDVMTAHKTKTPLDHPAKSVQEKHLADGAVSTRALSTTGVAAGTYKSVTVDTKGRVTAATNPTTLAGYGITDAYKKTESDARYLPVRGKAVDANSADKLNYTMIASGTDLNSLTSEGRYRCNTNVAAGTLLNCPVQSAFFLDVALGSYQTQLLYTLRSEVYIRSYQTAEWGDWVRLVSSNELITSINGIATNGGAVDLSNVFYKLNGSVSAQKLVTSGNIVKDRTTSTILLSGGTDAQSGAFLLLYGKDTSLPYKFGLISNTKELTGLQDGTLTWDGKNIVRSVNNINADVKGNVRLLTATQNSNGLLSAADKKTIDEIESTYAKILNAHIAENADLNTITTPGFYRCSSDVIAATVKNCPSKHAFGLEIIQAAYIGIQVLYTYYPAGIFIRSSQGWKTWSTWTQLADTSIATAASSGLMPRLSGNANDVMTGTGAWWNRAWKQAYSGDFTTLNGVVCTLPVNWQECIILYLDNQENYARKRSTPIIPRSCIDIEIWAGQGTAYEMGYKINTSNQLIMTHRGISSDAKIQYAYYR